ncbi:unnamed protein product [Euphydryas editha]|uniref:Uncharacterized protein n=1 Tax=Euphydryas editha TaxID=104508 RepID=A0AAU9UCF5_EUPED|nr:unnamed protein product [Euphydryas editha]
MDQQNKKCLCSDHSAIKCEDSVKDRDLSKKSCLCQRNGAISPIRKRSVDIEESGTEESTYLKDELCYSRNRVILPIGTRSIEGPSKESIEKESIVKESVHVSWNSDIPLNYEKINHERKIPKDRTMFKWIDETYPIGSEISSSSSLFSYETNSNDTQTTTTAPGINKITKYYTLF